MSLFTNPRRSRDRLRHRVTVLAAAAALALTGAAMAGPAQADSLVQIAGPAGSVPTGTPYTYTITATGPQYSSVLDVTAGLSGAAATVTAVSDADPTFECAITSATAVNCRADNPNIATTTITVTVLPTATGTVTATTNLSGITGNGSSIAGTDTTTTTIANPLPPAPTVTAVSPTSGTTAGGTPVTITGTNLTGATAVSFGTGNPATAVSCAATSCTATSPAEAAGTVDVQVTTAGGTSPTSSADQYTYVTPAADLGVTLTATGVPGILLGHINYTLTITDHGPSAVSSATVSAHLPTPMTATTPDCTATSHYVTCTIGALASGASLTRHFTAPIGLLTIGLPYAVTATRTAGSPADPNPANDSATRTCTVLTSLIIHCT